MQYLFTYILGLTDDTDQSNWIPTIIISEWEQKKRELYILEIYFNTLLWPSEVFNFLTRGDKQNAWIYSIFPPNIHTLKYLVFMENDHDLLH